MVRLGLAMAASGALIACSSPAEIGDEVGVATANAIQTSGPETPQPPVPPEAPAGADGGTTIFTDNADQDSASREFSYAWPKEVSAIPKLAAELTAQRDKQLADQKAYWAESIADCPPEFVSCRNATFELEWQVVADISRFLSLSNGYFSYSGGAHGNYGRGTLVWDREANASLDPRAMFTSLDALDAAISKPACELLNAERSERRGGEVFRGEGEWPNQCVSMDETVLFLGSSTGKTFDRIGVYYAPYIAGAYAEGDFEFTLPVTRAVIDAVKPEYRGAFALGK